MRDDLDFGRGQRPGHTNVKGRELSERLAREERWKA